MPQTRSVNNSFGEKLVSVLRQPLFTIPFPKPKSPTTAKPVKQKKAEKRNQHRPLAVNTPVKHNAVKRTGSTITFTPSRGRNEFETILFVLRARDKCGGTAFTNVLHIERTETGSRLIATDGKRMHVAEIGTRIKPGDYKPIVTKDVIRLGMPIPDVRFPDWLRAVPTKTIRRGCINLETADNGGMNRISNSFEKLSGEKVNPQYLSDLTKKPWAVYCQKEKRKALMLKEQGAQLKTYAVIMPLAA